ESEVSARLPTSLPRPDRILHVLVGEQRQPLDDGFEVFQHFRDRLERVAVAEPGLRQLPPLDDLPAVTLAQPVPFRDRRPARPRTRLATTSLSRRTFSTAASRPATSDRSVDSGPHGGKYPLCSLELAACTREAPNESMSETVDCRPNGGAGQARTVRTRTQSRC